MADIHAVLNIEQLDRDVFRSSVVKSNFQRTFGGQLVAQSLRAAIETVEDHYHIHSLHSYFVAPGRSDRPMLFLIDRIRDGRSFCIRQVKALQDGVLIFSMQASFHHDGERGISHEDRMRMVPNPEDVTMDPETLRHTARALFAEWPQWDIRLIPDDQFQKNTHTMCEQMVWCKFKEQLPDDRAFHTCALAYMSDMTLLESALVAHPDAQVQEASLDHSMWFIRPVSVDEWLLYEQTSPIAGNGRALTHGRIFDRAGRLMAIVSQEGLVRNLKPGVKAIPLTTIEMNQGKGTQK